MWNFPTARLLVVTAALTAHVARPTPAHAEETSAQIEQAKSLFNMGAQLYTAHKYTAAIQNFEEAYRLTPRPALLFSIAQAERRQFYETQQTEVLHSAIGHYRTYLAQADQGGRRAEAGQALTELELVAAQKTPTASKTAPPPAPRRPTLSVMATQVRGARVVVDGKPAEDGIFSEEVSPGKHTIKVSADGYLDEEREVNIQSAPIALDVTLRERMASLRFVALAGSQVSLDGRLIGITPLPTAIEVPAGPHIVSVAHSGHALYASEIELDRGESRTIEAQLPRTTQRKVAHGLFIGAGASLIAGGVFSGLALHSQSRANDILDARDQRTISADELRDYKSARDARDLRWRPLAIGSFAAAGGLGLVGALLYVFDQPAARASGPRERSRPAAPPASSPPPPAVEISATPWLAPGTLGLSTSGRF